MHLTPAGCDDDEFILRLALERNAFVLTNDLFRDHQRRGTISKDWVECHCLRFMFVANELLLPAFLPPVASTSPKRACVPRHAERPRLCSARPRSVPPVRKRQRHCLKQRKLPRVATHLRGAQATSRDERILAKRSS